MTLDDILFAQYQLGREHEELNQLERMLLDLKNKYQNRLNEE